VKTNQVLAEMESVEGKLLFRGTRYLLVRPETLVGFQQATGDPEAVAAGGFEGGRRTAARLAETLEGRAVLEAMAAMGGDLGWGKFRVARFGPRDFEVEVFSSPFAEAHGLSDRPVCHLIRGVLQGVGATLWGRAAAEELACTSTGAPACRFSCHD
jgi:predicted hydrocarbon binding protein